MERRRMGMLLPLFVSLLLPLLVRPARAHEFALIDMAAVFKSHRGFLEQMKALKQQVQDFDVQWRADGAALKASIEDLKEKKEGSEEYILEAADLVRRKAALEAARDNLKLRLKRDEARLYADTYQQIHREVAKIARRDGYRLVLRFQSAKFDRDASEEVLKAMNRSVVYQYDCDITAQVIAAVNAASGDADPAT